MRYERTELFKADYQQLSEHERELFRAVARIFNAACDRFIETKDPSSWPASLRVKAVVNAPGIFEMNWSFSGPDGRATWQWATVVTSNGVSVPAVRWRRIGGHQIFRQP
ncbi:hypothetical protein SAMN02745225_02370 [Ferrithrix thermotolerans DSM 19514]|uniref:Uncharacterized protein n=1 Tax=Ferrithrix thermotolerans DSM 19514 TaxID=1121881 RepID=A0A1M4YM85_9ACTN|nr:hypothetical protein SAMN02745225_02370 [Ferrithrix thermotolerans DSM 19514]